MMANAMKQIAKCPKQRKELEYSFMCADAKGSQGGGILVRPTAYLSLARSRKIHSIAVMHLALVFDVLYSAF